jgi:AcrR family transcriptional regulator
MPVMQRRARDTRTSLLHAAREVFAEVGYAEANVADLVARAGSSVGSMYHHFGGKADLYQALYEDFQSRQEARADGAVIDARLAGEEDPLRLFLAGSRAFLTGCWEERDLARLFLNGDGPPGFEEISRARFQSWVERGGGLIRREGRESPHAVVLVLTTVIAAAGREVAQQPSAAGAELLADEVLGVLGQLAAAPVDALAQASAQLPSRPQASAPPQGPAPEQSQPQVPAPAGARTTVRLPDTERVRHG